MPKITKRTVDAAAPDPDRRYHLWDTKIRGFGLLVLPSGVKSYVYQYRTPEGVTRRATIGKHGDWTADLARDKADARRRDVKDGRDRLGEKRSIRQAPTVGEVLDAYLDSERFKNKAPSTQAIDRGRIERHLRPTLGRKHAHLLTAREVERAGAAIRDGKTAVTVKTKKRGKARVTGGEGTARMAVELLRSAFSWAVREGIVKANPCEHVSTGSSGTRDTILEDAADYARLFQTLDTMAREKRIRGTAADAIRMIALTGARRGEIAGLRWSHVDMKRGMLVLPPTAHKSGHKTGKPREIGLPAVAQAVIARQPEGKPDEFVFRPAKGDGAISLSKIWRTVRAEAELPESMAFTACGIPSARPWHGPGQGRRRSWQPSAIRSLPPSSGIHWAQNARQALSEQAA